MSRGSGIHLPRPRGRPAGRQFRIFEREVCTSGLGNGDVVAKMPFSVGHGLSVFENG